MPHNSGQSRTNATWTFDAKLGSNNSQAFAIHTSQVKSHIAVPFFHEAQERHSPVLSNTIDSFQKTGTLVLSLTRRCWHIGCHD